MVQTFQYFSKRPIFCARELVASQLHSLIHSYKAAKLRDGSEEEEQPSVG
jgi:hypothetical protein